MGRTASVGSVCESKVSSPCPVRGVTTGSFQKRLPRAAVKEMGGRLLAVKGSQDCFDSGDEDLQDKVSRPVVKAPRMSLMFMKEAQTKRAARAILANDEAIVNHIGSDTLGTPAPEEPSA
ncbi:hypothetical protein VM1G_11953 [Cytospora mali]|uniref:Uncharacterized protein n=1 Tax=Cytospora mali TaxID=578113 RepID=A0A194WDQ9_CYTMA|nr:hypothetical protein VM1G_11953 [Valsa mali]